MGVWRRAAATSDGDRRGGEEDGEEEEEEFDSSNDESAGDVHADGVARGGEEVMVATDAVEAGAGVMEDGWVSKELHLMLTVMWTWSSGILKRVSSEGRAEGREGQGRAGQGRTLFCFCSPPFSSNSLLFSFGAGRHRHGQLTQ